MINALNVQIAFLLFEAVFCFIASIVALFQANQRKSVRFLLTLLNLMAGVILACDSLAYIYCGSSSHIYYVMARLSNGLVYMTSMLILSVYAMYVAVRAFGDFSIRRHAPARGRLIACFLLSATGVILVIVSQFTGLYYSFDELNNYRRGPGFLLSLFFPVAVAILVATILVQYRKKLGKWQLLALSSYLILPAAGMVVQALFYGYSYMNIGLGLSALLIFIECTISKNNELSHVARTEMRTGLANEHGCVEWLNSMQGKPRLLEYSAVFFDLIKFSDINRKYGMTEGNVILASYGLALSETLEKDELLARQYGNQFVAVIKNDHVNAFLDHLSGMEVSFYDKLSEDVRTVTVSARCGVFRIDRTDLDGEEIISCAAIALSMAKNKTGVNSVFMTRELLNDMEKRRQFENEIEQGLQNNEFVPYYQPKVDALTHTLCGAEALARWEHDGNVLSPAAFVALMEENHSISNLDLCILDRVCKDLTSWIEQGLNPPTVSVNISRRNLADPAIADRINDIIQSNHVPRHLIEIEVTETADEFPIFVLKNFVDALHEYGYLVSIDDFGCASSSLTLLREITFDTIKIDKGFVDKDYSKDLTILEYIVKMAKTLELKIVAEGIEHEGQVRTLLDMGVTVIQGYFFDMPLSAADMKKRLTSPTYEEVKRPD